MRLVFLFTLVASLAHADALPDVVFGSVQGRPSTITMADGRMLHGTISAYDAQHVALIDEVTRAVVPLARQDIASVRLDDPPPPPRPHLTMKPPHLSVLTKVGLGLFTATYGLAFAGGVSFMSWNEQEERWGDDAYGPELWKQGYELLVPVVGPFLSARDGQGFPSWWEGVWIADGVAQIASVSILIAGLVREHTHAQPLAYHGVTFNPSVTPQSIGLSGTF